ncbi:type 2 lantibiotic biosynthesis protein LanM [Nocardiopsis flavescens]|uniref:Type 2 lantibiotic biosynthesis protein LanM n=1 Tax=Nocardiopsis flavescens TaxID=758803 RepID=A0A1M6JK15_9ACTN|nr:type 2 lanthipeptide synthetase LanM [Nocardiopsis flavescens]SHJ47003.1 type 2 lantibiotic biosynthesis protein LanM [Nocardiopsis flavescens]
MARVEPEAVSRVLDTYIPELSPGETRDHLSRRLEDRETSFEECSEEEFPGPGPYDPGRDPDGRLVDYFRHHVLAWSRDLEADVRGSTCLDGDNTAFEDFVAAQVPAVAELLVRTLLRELFLRRSAGLLRGGSPQERYRSFREWTNSAEGHRRLLSRYPRAFRSARDRVRNAGAGLRHILSRIETHRAGLDALPGVTAGVRVATVLAGQGDMHNGGRSVAQVVFSDGARVLYKPRPLESETGFNAIVEWFNERLGPSLPTVRVLPCGDEGFVEYVRAGEPRSGSAGYFVRIGRLLGILYLVKAIDIHFENVVTCAGGPVVVDTETLLTPRLAARGQDADRSATAEAHALLGESVTGIGVLPFTMRRAGPGEVGMDVGVIGYDPGQEAPYKSLQFRNPGRDDMFVELVRGTSANSTANLSVARAADLPLREQRDAVKSELRRVLEYAASHKETVAGVVGEHLGKASFRFLHQPTVFYSQLLSMVTHPDAVTDPLIREALLSRVFLRARGAYEIAEDEARQLAEGDVPYFHYSADSRALLAGDGRVVLEEAFDESGLDAVRARIAGLDGRAIDRQAALVDLSFVAKLPLSDDVTGFSWRPSGRTAPARADRPRFLDEAVRIGDLLVDAMVEGSDPRHPAVWIGPQVAAPEGEEWTPGASGFDFYTGMPGIALALAGLARETGQERFRAAALKVVEPLEALLLGGSLGALGGTVVGMCGPDGIAYAVATARRLLGGGGPGAGRLARALVSDMATPNLYDFVTGSAGTLAVCLSLHRDAADGEERELTGRAAAFFADHVMKGVRESGGGEGRVTGYTGYAHGDMGIAAKLLEYAAAFGDREALASATRMAEAVRDARTGRDRDWPRVWGESDYSYAWCHGAPGILMGALEVNRHAPGLFPEEALGRLAELTAGRGFGNNPTYCHGDLGSLETVLLAQETAPGLFGDGAADLYPRLFAEVVERYSERADTKYAYSHGIMLGQSGLLWSVLRHLDPRAYPSIVRLA